MGNPSVGDIETGACEFEHILALELVASICTLLGHPKECPWRENTGGLVLQTSQENLIECGGTSFGDEYW